MPNKWSALLHPLPGGFPLTHTGGNDSKERRQVKYSLNSLAVRRSLVTGGDPRDRETFFQPFLRDPQSTLVCSFE